MSRNVRVLRCSPEDVFEVLADGWMYPGWVVGASRMRTVDDEWPAVDAKLHHSFGVWPVLIDDKTVVEQYSPPERMVVRAHGWPVGEARVTIDVKPRGDATVVRIQEEPIAGPGLFIPKVVLEPLLHWRNTETLHRLAYLAEGHAAGRSGATTADAEMSSTDAEDTSDAEEEATGSEKDQRGTGDLRAGDSGAGEGSEQ